MKVLAGYNADSFRLCFGRGGRTLLVTRWGRGLAGSPMTVEEAQAWSRRCSRYRQLICEMSIPMPETGHRVVRVAGGAALERRATFLGWQNASDLLHGARKPEEALSVVRVLVRAIALIGKARSPVVLREGELPVGLDGSPYNWVIREDQAWYIDDLPPRLRITPGGTRVPDEDLVTDIPRPSRQKRTWIIDACYRRESFILHFWGHIVAALDSSPVSDIRAAGDEARQMLEDALPPGLLDIHSAYKRFEQYRRRFFLHRTRYRIRAGRPVQDDRRVQVILVVGGKGTRLGHERAKCLVEVCGEPLLRHQLDDIAPLVERLLVPLPPDHPPGEQIRGEVKRLFGDLDADFFPDPGEGPTAAVRVAARHLSQDLPVLVVIGDLIPQRGLLPLVEELIDADVSVGVCPAPPAERKQFTWACRTGSGTVSFGPDAGPGREVVSGAYAFRQAESLSRALSGPGGMTAALARMQDAGARLALTRLGPCAEVNTPGDLVAAQKAVSSWPRQQVDRR